MAGVWSVVLTGDGLSVNGNLTQLPPPVTPVVSSKSSPVCRCNHAFLRCLGAEDFGARKKKSVKKTS